MGHFAHCALLTLYSTHLLSSIRLVVPYCVSPRVVASPLAHLNAFFENKALSDWMGCGLSFIR